MKTYRIAIPCVLYVDIAAKSRAAALTEAAELTRRAGDGIELDDWDTELSDLGGVVYPTGEGAKVRDVREVEE